jgi:hypothetical protein
MRYQFLSTTYRVSFSEYTSVETAAFLTVAEEKRLRELEQVKKRAIEFRQRIKRLANGPEFFPVDHKIRQIASEFPVWRYSEGFTETLGIDMN